MDLTEDQIIEKYAKNVSTAIGTLYYHMNMNGLVFHVII